MPRLLATATWPSTSASASSALRTTGSTVAGRTRPTARSRRPASSRALGKLPSDSVRPTSTRLPSAWPSSSPSAKRCSKARAHTVSSSASATRQRRMSAGGAAPRSRRSRPDEPPSSATLTTAVIVPAYPRMARSAVARPCPPPSATARGPSTTVDVPAADVRPDAAPLKPARQRLGDDHAAVLAAGAADADREVRLALALVRGQQQREQAIQLLEEGARLGLAEHGVTHTRIGASERAQLLDPVRVGQEAAVEHEVDVGREAVLVPERDDVRLQGTGGLVDVEQLAQPVAQLVHVELAGVEDDVGAALHVLEQHALRGDALGDAITGRQRVLPAGRLVAAHQHLVVGVGEKHPGAGDHLLELGERRDEVVDELARAHIDHEPEPLRALRPAPELGHLGDERRRQVVDHEEPEVFEHVGGRGATGPGHPGDDGDVERHAGPLVPARSPARSPCNCAWTARATFSGSLGISTSSSSVSSRSRLTEPCSFNRRAFRVGPSPGTSSSTERVIFLSRSCRWYVMAKRCASSRTCWSKYSASESRGMCTGSG